MLELGVRVRGWGRLGVKVGVRVRGMGRVRGRGSVRGMW